MKKIGDEANEHGEVGVPDWARRPFQDFLDDVRRLGQVVEISARGIAMLRATPRAVEVLMDVERDSSPERTAQLDAARQHAALATREVADDFPVLHSWAVVALWAHLEALIRTFLSAWLRNQRSSWACEPIQRLRIRLGEYETIPPSLRHLYIVELLEKETGAGIRSGVQRFEALLEPFGLSGPVPKRIADVLYELGQVRNLIAHNASRVDRRLRNACPWLNAKLGSLLHVSSGMLDIYLYASTLYVTLLICRMRAAFGGDMAGDMASVEQDAEKLPDRVFKGTGPRRDR